MICIDRWVLMISIKDLTSSGVSLQKLRAEHDLLGKQFVLQLQNTGACVMESEWIAGV